MFEERLPRLNFFTFAKLKREVKRRHTSLETQHAYIATKENFNPKWEVSRESTRMRAPNFYRHNEFVIPWIGEYLQDRRGTGVAIGVEHGLDLLATSAIHTLHIVDLDPQAILLSRVYMEASLRFKQLLGRVPKAKEIAGLMKKEKLLLKLLSLPTNKYNFPQEELDSLRNFLPTISGALAKNIRKKSMLPLCWPSQQAFPHIVESYEKGNIFFHAASIADTQTLSSINKEAKERGENISIMYLSNVPELLGLGGTLQNFTKQLSNLTQLSPDAHIIFTDGITSQQGYSLSIPGWEDANTAFFTAYIQIGKPDANTNGFAYFKPLITEATEKGRYRGIYAFR